MHCSSFGCDAIYLPLRNADMLWCPRCENRTSSTKPEVHNVSQCHQTGTEPQPCETYTQNFVKLRDKLEIQVSRQTDKQTDMLITILCTAPGREINIIKIKRNSRGTDSLQFEELWSELISDKTTSVRVGIIIFELITVTCKHHHGTLTDQ